MDHGQILEQPYYTTAPTTNAETNNIVMPPIDFNTLQGFQPQPTQTQFTEQPQAYSQLDFFYETPHISQQPTNTSFNQIPVITTNDTSTVLNTSLDEDYVQNLTNELQHTKQLLKQYQLRTEQLMELVTKQTAKIKELREQLSAAPIT